MARYDYKCDTCEAMVEVSCLPYELAENWPTCPTEGCDGEMSRVWTAPVTIWKTPGSTKDKRGLPDVR